MGFLHVGLAVAETLRLVRTVVYGRPVTSIHDRRLGMLVVDVAFTLFLCGPALLVILAVSVRTLPRTFVTLHVFRTVARTAEDLVASVKATVVRLDGLALSTTCHGPLHVIIQRVSHDGTLR